MSEKIAVISSITWLIGWMRPRVVGAGADRQGDVDALGGEPRRRAPASASAGARLVDRAGDLGLAAR